MEAIVDQYFHAGFKYKEIIALLKRCHGKKVSLRTLHRLLRQQNLYRKGIQSPVPDIVSFIQHELQGSGSCIGYRAMQQRCIKNQLNVSRGLVAQIMKELDPVGVDARRRRTLRCSLYFNKGPNWVWHLDGYDKLKPFGFEGRVDAYYAWLNVLKSNKDPKEVTRVTSTLGYSVRLQYKGDSRCEFKSTGFPPEIAVTK